jgi:hypothetical protein
MRNSAALSLSKYNVKTLLINAAALAFIYFVPALSHMLALPVYFIEPMRLMLIIAIAHTNLRNAFIIAATLPLFSFLVSAHPHLLKMMLISAELILNVGLFYFILKRTGNAFVSIFSSIVLSKAAYYLIKIILINTALMSGSLVSIPLYFQLITTVIFSSYLFFILKNTTQSR